MTGKKKSVIVIAMLLAVGILSIAAVFGYAAYEARTLLRNEFEIADDHFTDEITAVLIADLHDWEFGEGNRQLVTAIEKEEPDAVFMVGDFINGDSKDSHIVLELTEKLTEIAPVYFSLGNHESLYIKRTGEDLVTELTDAGAVVLEMEYEDIEINGQQIRIGGMLDYAFALDGRDSTNPETMDPEMYRFLTDFQETERYKIMLAHRPESFVLGEASVTWDVDLVLSGHAHGGQIVIPGMGGLWAPDQGWFPKYIHGFYQKDKIELLITSGLGSSAQLVPRLNNPPEIAVVTFKAD